MPCPLWVVLETPYSFILTPPLEPKRLGRDRHLGGGGGNDQTVVGTSLGPRTCWSSLGIFEFQGPSWQGSWVSPCLGTASLGTLSTPHLGWSLQGCVSVSYFYSAPGRTPSMPPAAWLFETVPSNRITTWWQRTLVISKTTIRRRCYVPDSFNFLWGFWDERITEKTMMREAGNLGSCPDWVCVLSDFFFFFFFFLGFLSFCHF